MSVFLTRILCITFFVAILSACAGGMYAISSDQSESMSIKYNDGMGTRDVVAKSSVGETFIGTLIWIKDLGASGHYKGGLIGDEGRTIEVVLECNVFTTKCVGTGRADDGKAFFIH